MEIAGLYDTRRFGSFLAARRRKKPSLHLVYFFFFSRSVRRRVVLKSESARAAPSLLLAEAKLHTTANRPGDCEEASEREGASRAEKGMRGRHPSQSARSETKMDEPTPILWRGVVALRGEISPCTVRPLVARVLFIPPSPHPAHKINRLLIRLLPYRALY